MESNLFIDLAEEQQEVVAGGGSLITGSSFENLIKTLNKTLNFSGASSSGPGGTSTNGTFASTKNKTYNFLKNSGGTTIYE